MDIYSKFEVDSVFRYTRKNSSYYNDLFIVDIRSNVKVLVVLKNNTIWSHSRICFEENVRYFHEVNATLVKGS